MADLPSGMVTFLVTDLKGSSDLWERHPRRMPHLLARVEALIRGAVEAHRGHVFQVIGDTILAAFATVRDGLAAAVAAQRALCREPWSEDCAVSVAMALHTAAAEPRGGEYFGSPIVHLVQVGSLAHGGQILLSRATAQYVLSRTVTEHVRETLPPGASLRDLGEERLRGVRRPEWIFQLVALGLPDDFPPLRTPANRTQELTRTVQELRALEQFSRAISATLDLEQVLSTIVAHATELVATDGWAFYESDGAGRDFRLRAAHEMPDEVVTAVTQTWRDGKPSLLAQAALLRRTVQVHDINDEHAFPRRVPLVRGGTRALLAVPLLRDDALVGLLVARRTLPGRFPPESVDLIQAFAAQAVLAIQNARLYQALDEQSRQLAAANRHKSEFLANMSHELRTPLNAVIGFSEVLLARMFGDLTEKQDEYLQDILTSGHHLLDLINEILDLSKIEAGRMELDVDTFALVEAVEHGLAMVRERAARHGIALSYVVAPGVGMVEADERKVKQVLVNLLSNAVKFTPDGGRVDVSVRPVGDRVEIAVRDTGIGIAPEEQQHIFEEFRQAAQGQPQEGTGLGLTLAQRFVELHGGAIRVESAVGEGSTFTVTLPVRQPAARAARDPAHPSPAVTRYVEERTLSPGRPAQ